MTASCHRPAPVWLSLAIIPWAGRITDAIHGTAMEVDYVRVYERKDKIPSAIPLAAVPELIRPVAGEWRHGGLSVPCEFPPLSFTVMELE